MLTGTPLDLTPFGSLLAAIGLAYWLLVVALVGLSLWWPRRWIVKLPLAAIVLVTMVYPVVSRIAERKAESNVSKARLDASMAHFSERCKSAGEKITRTVENVDGVVWMKWRENYSNSDDQWKLDDPYGRDCGGEECIAALLRPTEGVELNPEGAKRHSAGYRFVETTDPSDGQRYRYTAGMRLSNEDAREKEQTGRVPPPYSYRFKVERGSPIAAFTARYGIVWDDISTHEDREHWIAGGSLTVIDLQSDEVLAVRAGYLIDTGQGSKAGFRSPWGWAKAYAPRCPGSDESARGFGTRVLKVGVRE